MERPKHTDKQVLRSSAWMSGYRMLRMVVAFVVGILVARYLGPELYGKLSYSVALIMLFIGVAGPGMKDVITRRLDSASDPASVLRASFRLMLVMNIVLLGVALLVTVILRPSEQIIWAMVAIIGLGNVFRAFESFELLFLYRLQMARTVSVQAASFFTISALKLLLIWYEAGIVLFAVAVGAELVLTGAGFWWLYRREHKGSSDADTGGGRSAGLERIILKTSLPAIAGLAFTVMLFKADQVMLGWLSGDAEVGRYAIAAQFSEYWIYLATALVTSSYPNMLEAFRNSQRDFDEQFSRLCAVLLYGGICIAIPVWLLGEWIILLFLGDDFAGSAVILGIHIWSVFFVFMLEAMKKYYVIRSILPAYVKVGLFAAVLNIGLNLWLIPLYDGVGAAWSTVIAYGAAGFWGLFLFKETRGAGLLIAGSLLYPFRRMMDDGDEL